LLCEHASLDERDAKGHELVPIRVGPGGHFSAAAVISELRARGLRRIFIEGGGVTVSTFFEENALDRLQITLAPIFLGNGRRGIALSGIERLDQAFRPKTRRFALGDDVLFDCELTVGHGYILR
jgi:diaminohydroxyphosphoribosylaminopyrimidine deaminase / 5-amino-6-(5-phosphoribosylamino)uracil reductase